MEEKDDNDQADHNDLFQQVALQSGDRGLNQAGAIVSSLDFDAWRQRRPDLRQLPLDIVDDIQGVHPIPHHYDAAHRLSLAIPFCYPTANVGPIGDRAEITDQHRNPVARGGYGNIIKVLQRVEVTEATDHVFGSAEFEQPAAHFVSALAHAINHPGKLDVIGAELVWIKIHLELLYESSDGGDFRDAWHGFELIAQIPILKGAQIRQAVLVIVINKHVFVDPSRSGRVRPDHRMDVWRQLTLNLLEVFRHPRPRPVEIGSILEDDEDVGISKHRLGADSLYARRGEHRGNDRVCDLVFNDVGWFSWPLGEDDDFHIRDIWQRVERNPAQRIDSGQYKQERPCKYEEAIAGAPVNPTMDHLHPSPGAYSELLGCDGLPALLGRNGNLPGSAARQIPSSFVEASAFVIERRHCAHRRHAYGGHSWHEKCDGHLRSGDRFAI